MKHVIQNLTNEIILIDQKKEQAGGRSSCHPCSQIIQPQVQIISGNHRVNPV